jgi:hypothetical protein
LISLIPQIPLQHNSSFISYDKLLVIKNFFDNKRQIKLLIINFYLLTPRKKTRILNCTFFISLYAERRFYLNKIRKVIKSVIFSDKLFFGVGEKLGNDCKV